MKTLSQRLKQVFDALDFTNANHLHALNKKLDSHEVNLTPSPAQDDRIGEMENAKPLAAHSL